MFASLLLSATSLAVPAQHGDLPYAEIASEKAILFAFYDKKSAQVLVLEQGMPVQVVTEYTPWTKVRVPGGLNVWVHKDYVVWEGGVGSITSSRVRIRPRPSTDASSTPLGHFQKDDQVLLLSKKDDWFEVRAPETVSAWVLTSELRMPQRDAASWKRIWAEHKSARSVEPVVLEDDVDPSVEEVVSADPVKNVGGEAVEASSGGVASAADAVSPESEKEKWTLFRSVDVAKEPELQRLNAVKSLEALASAVTSDNMAWDRRRLDNLEMVFGHVIWHSTDLQSTNQARRSLTRIDGLRRFYFSALAADVRRAMAAKQVDEAARLDKMLAAEKKPVVYEGEGSSVEIGWVEYRPSVNANMPYCLVRGGRELPMHSFDGNQDLKEFVNRELVVRGIWRNEKSLAAGRVLAITELRVLPPRE
ncbi:MAG: SH3 domain-containing protein [Planctomycetota bacterium]|nr:SH3 domain-containing protein [Planctomycetota bacterium]MDA1114380.1 SH3 domain-containing protein [Planctomycetota bacterium]